MIQRTPGDTAATDDNPPTSPPDLQPLPLDLVSPQLTGRAILTGVLLGGLFSICNVYIGLKIGLVINMSLVAALVGYGFWSGLRRLGGSQLQPWGILENNINQTACSSGAAVASAGLVAPIPAFTLLTGKTLPWHWLALWVFSVCLVGITVAIALRRHMLIRENLPFVVGLASAEMLREMHARGVEALARVKILVSFALLGSAGKLIEQYLLVGERARFKLLALPGAIKGFALKSLSFAISPTLLVLPAIGGLIGFRACLSLLVGCVFALGVLSPSLVRSGTIRLTVTQELSDLPSGVTIPEARSADVVYFQEKGVLQATGILNDEDAERLRSQSSDTRFLSAINELVAKSRAPPQHVTYGALLGWLLWPGMTLMVVASLTSLALSWRSVLAAVSRGAAGGRVAQRDTGEVTHKWFATGLIVAFILSATLQIALFEVVWWAAVLGVLLSFGLALVAARVSGETGITPVGSMGKVTQFIFGAMIPKNPVPNLMAANVAGGAASQCADLLHDLKCGHLLGASPRLQSIAQILGALAGAMVGSAAYLLLIPDPQKDLISSEWPAAGVVVWKGVAELFSEGLGGLPRGATTAMPVAAVAAVLLAVAEKVVPRRLRWLALSPASVGLAFVLPAYYSITIFLGGLIALIVTRASPNWSQRFLVAACAGIVAGESITGVGVSLQKILMS